MVFKEKSSTPQVIQTYLYPTNKNVPIGAKVTVNTSYMQLKEGSQNGQLRNAFCHCILPLSFFVTMGPPGEGKNNEEDYKLNFVLNKQMPSMLSLFEDVIEGLQAREVCNNKKAMTFIYHNQLPVHILISKDEIKVRV
mmetsp:Transcript_27459/g.26540  ORF Transcript_27459/g.26540 Transcript_27459/m.26540 type:complete len:138 (-) Transcript_27459:695-1108(-)